MRCREAAHRRHHRRLGTRESQMECAKAVNVAESTLAGALLLPAPKAQLARSLRVHQTPLPHRMRALSAAPDVVRASAANCLRRARVAACLSPAPLQKRAGLRQGLRAVHGLPQRAVLRVNNRCGRARVVVLASATGKELVADTEFTITKARHLSPSPRRAYVPRLTVWLRKQTTRRCRSAPSGWVWGSRSSCLAFSATSTLWAAARTTASRRCFSSTASLSRSSVRPAGALETRQLGPLADPPTLPRLRASQASP